MSRTWPALALLVVLVLLGVPLGAASDGDPTDDGGAASDAAAVGLNPDHLGYALYQSFCSECHGVRADGNGPRSRRFDPRPVDLTQIQGLDGAPPSLERLSRVIDGRRTIRAHEEDGMPIWGSRLVANEPVPERQEHARIRLVQTLAEYVLSIRAQE
jgi:mono/diheme cytochrome c family protein